jgi:hypothetical protein
MQRRAETLVFSTVVFAAEIAVFTVVTLKAEGPNRVVPLRANFTETVLKNGAYLITKRQAVSVRNDRSVARVTSEATTATGAKELGLREVFDATVGVRIVAVPSLEIKSSTLLDDGQTERVFFGGNVCAGGGSSTKAVHRIAQYDVISIVVTSETKAGLVREETWAAPALACFVLRRERSVIDGEGNVIAQSVLQAESVERDAPVAEHFTIPSQWREHPPGDLLKAIAEARGRGCDKCISDAAAQANAEYLQKRDGQTEGRK